MGTHRRPPPWRQRGDKTKAPIFNADFDSGGTILSLSSPTSGDFGSRQYIFGGDNVAGGGGGKEKENTSPIFYADVQSGGSIVMLDLGTDRLPLLPTSWDFGSRQYLFGGDNNFGDKK